MFIKTHKEATFAATMLIAAAGLVISVLGFSFGVPLSHTLLAMAASVVFIRVGLYVYLVRQLVHQLPKGPFLVIVPRTTLLCQDQCSA